MLYIRKFYVVQNTYINLYPNAVDHLGGGGVGGPLIRRNRKIEVFLTYERLVRS